MTMRAWILSALVVVAGLVLGALAGAAVLGGRVSAETRLVVGDQTIRAQSVPGYALATMQLAATYSRLVSSDSVTGRMPEGVTVDASPIPDSGIVRVVAQADDEATAISAADTAAEALIAAADTAQSKSGGDAVAEEYLVARRDLFEKQAKARAATATAQDVFAVDLAQARVDAMAQAYREQVISASNNATGLAVTQKAQPVSSTTPRAGALGALAGGALAVLLVGIAYLVRVRRV